MLVSREDFDLLFNLTRSIVMPQSEDKENSSAWPGHKRKKTPFRLGDQEDTVKDLMVTESIKSTEGRKRRTDSSLYAETSRDGTICKVSPDHHRRLSQTQVISHSSLPRSGVIYMESELGTPKNHQTVSSANTRGSKPRLRPTVWA
jgi:hypothetical protein